MTGAAVKSPGMFEIRQEQGPREALTLAGGLLLPEGDVIVTLMRGRQNLTVDLNAHPPLALQHGDVLMATPVRNIHVTVSGQVVKPGLCDLKAGEGLVSAITQAGGATDKASLCHVKITHADGRCEDVDVNAAFVAGAAEPPVLLSSGDLVMVPENTRLVSVQGYVKQPGSITLREGKDWTLSEVIGLASGPVDQRAGIANVLVLRKDATGKQTRMIYNVEKYLKKGDVKQNPLIQPGDLIFVPETNTPNWAEIFQGLTALGVVGEVVR